MKKSLVVALLLVVASGAALGVAGCGGSDEGDSSSATTAKPADIRGTVTVWNYYSGSFPNYDEVNEELISEFEKKYPNVKVVDEAKPIAGYEAAYRTAFASREGPDVIMMPAGLGGVLSYKKGLEVLNDRISPELQEQINNWGSATPGFTTEGDHYGVPMFTTGYQFYYNKKLFAKAGLPRDFAPKSWDEVKETGEQLKEAGIQPFTGGNKEGFENGWWYVSGWQAENPADEAFELGEGKIPWTDELVTKAYQPQIMMYEADLYPEDVFTTPAFPDGAASFANEEGAMYLGLRTVTGFYGEFIPALGEKNLGMFLPPGSSYLDNIPEWVWSMPTFATNKDGAWAFIDFMSSKRGIEKFVDTGAYLPNRKDVSVPGDAPEQAKQIVKWMGEYDLAPIAAAIPPSVSLVSTPEMSQVLQGRTSLSSMQDKMQEAAEKTTP